jgi:type IV pilus assembly protein PilX
MSSSLFVNHRSQRKDRGFALFSAMIFLVVLTVLAVTVLRTSTLGERVAGNDLDRTRAYQAAEATIRDAQRDILQITNTGADCSGLPSCRDSLRFASKDSGATDLVPGCLQGICFYTAAEYAATGFQAPWVAGTQYAEYGQFTGANWNQLNEQFRQLQQLAQRPRYWVEILQNPINLKIIRYRITVQAFGVNPNTVVSLQEIYEPGI